LSQKKIMHFFRIEKQIDQTERSQLSQEESRKHRRRSCSLTVKKRRRKLLPMVPSEDPEQRFAQMGTLASALTALGIKYSDDLTYVPGMAPRSANRSKFEKGGMQVLSKEDLETLELCRAMYRRGECPPLVVVFDPLEGYTVEADGPIKDLTFIAEYTGDVDYLKNRENDDCDSIMTLLLSEDPSKTLVICPDKYGNISRFISGINNHNRFGKKKQNCKCVRYSVNGECRVLLVATRDIAKGERLYYDYNGYEHDYTVEADGPIKDLTFIAEYTGDVDYLKNRENDDCDSIMTLLLSEDPSKTLVICPDKYGYISRFISGINNHNRFGKKKQNCKCVRYSVNGECRVLLVATRDISKGERLYYD
ncbi:hypothetical protein F2Q70_00006400, partial [Brassica cretica]